MSHIIMVVTLIAIWFLGSVGGNAWHVFTSHFCYKTFSFTIGHHHEQCHTLCCNHSDGFAKVKPQSADGCDTCSKAGGDESCFCREASDLQSELARHSTLIITYDQIKQLCVEIFDKETSLQPRQWHVPPLLCYSSRHLLSMFAVLII